MCCGTCQIGIPSQSGATSMNTYLLTWNPKSGGWRSFERDFEAFLRQGFFCDKWECSNTHVSPGDHLYLLRQGTEPKGIIASGVADSGPFPDKRFDKSKITTQVLVRFDVLLKPEKPQDVLSRSRLDEGQLSSVNWNTHKSGILINPVAAELLGKVWRAFLRKKGAAPLVSAEEVSEPSPIYEGAIRRIVVNAYERDPRARMACVEHYGANCSVCGFDFERMYGRLGKGFIHVHHLFPLSRIRRSYVVNPVRDLRPVCPNCHAMLHVEEKVLPVDRLRKIVKSRKFA